MALILNTPLASFPLKAQHRLEPEYTANQVTIYWRTKVSTSAVAEIFASPPDQNQFCGPPSLGTCGLFLGNDVSGTSS
jgi:hypothetical protein